MFRLLIEEARFNLLQRLGTKFDGETRQDGLSVFKKAENREWLCNEEEEDLVSVWLWKTLAEHLSKSSHTMQLKLQKRNKSRRNGNSVLFLNEKKTTEFFLLKKQMRPTSFKWVWFSLTSSMAVLTLERGVKLTSEISLIINIKVCKWLYEAWSL